MKRKLLIFSVLIAALMCVLALPASASCDDCIAWEDNLRASDTEHCTVHCTGCDSYDICGSCGDTYLLEFCSATHDFEKVILINPGTTCQDGGTEVWQCDCGATTVYPGSAYGDHDWDDGVIDEEDGVIRYTCKHCGESTADQWLPDHTHNYVKTVYAPTCTAKGYTHYRCSCGSVYFGDYVDPIDHRYVATVVVPTCQSVGYTMQVCEFCRDTIISDEKPISDHIWKPDGTIQGPSCSTHGYLSIFDRNHRSSTYEVLVPEGSSFATIGEISGKSVRVNVGTEASPTYVLVNTAVTSVDSKNAYGRVLASFAIPCETLDSWGHGLDNYRNRLVYDPGLDTWSYIQNAVELVFDGSEAWKLRASASGDADRNYVSLNVGSYGSVVNRGILSNEYETYALAFTNATIGVYVLNSNGYNAAMITVRPWSGITDVNAWKTYLQERYAAGDPVRVVYALSTPIVTDVTDLFSNRNLIPVEPNGNLVFANEYALDLDTTVTFSSFDTTCANGHLYFDDICYVCDHELDEWWQPSVCHFCGETSRQRVTGPEHDFLDKYVDATCASPGYMLHTCQKCGVSYRDNYVGALDHTWGSRVVDEAAGKIYYTCKVCGTVKEEDYTPSHKHSYTTTVTPPTCTTRGYTFYKCSCGYSYYDDYIAVLGHDYAVTVIAPTCSSSGYHINTCKVCEHYFISDTVPQLEHKWQTTVTEPTCTVFGFTTKICSVCGDDVVVDQQSPKGHNIVNGVCTRCGYSSSCIHTYRETVYPPTCHDQGYTLYTCTKCGDGTIGDYVSALVHSWKETDRRAAQCERDGYVEKTCTRCGDVEFQTLTMTGHKWHALSAVVDEQNHSVVTYACAVCNHRKTETLQTAASQAQNWLLTSIRGFSAAIIDMYEIVANGIEVGGVTAGEVISGCLIVAALLLLIGLFIGRGR
ncbi:MAG: hypothetical protein IJW99_10595 [Clostridia bacterium]|nr:hypothetical protein [Clostridia bacterium]